MEKKVIHKLLTQLHTRLRHGKIEKYTQGGNQRLTAPLNPSNVPVPNTAQGRSSHTRVWAGKKHLANWDVLHLDTTNSNGWAVAAARDCWTQAGGSSQNKQWFEFELTLHNIHSAATWRQWHNDKKAWSRQSQATECTWRSRSWRWHSATKQHRGVNKDTLHQPKNESLF